MSVPTALEHLEHAMPGVLAAPPACHLLHGGGEVFVTHLEWPPLRQWRAGTKTTAPGPTGPCNHEEGQ